MMHAIPVEMKVERKMLRVRRFDQRGNMTDLISCLRAQRFTGTLELHFGQGSIHAATASDSQTVPEPALDRSVGDV